jgi:signal transduction histidine kinase
MAPGGPVSETTIKYADGSYHAHVQVPTASRGILIARGTLLLALDAAVLAALWMAGVAGRGRKPFLTRSWRVWFRSIQAQVTCALFAFFLIPTVLFGYFAYRSLEKEVVSTTLRVAQEAAGRAAVDFNARAVDLQQIAAETGADVLRYLGGELIDASTPGALQLGAYSGWVPARVYQQLEAGAEPGATDMLEMGGSHLVTAFHSTAPSGILAVPFPLYSISTIGRASGFAHLAMFSVLVGAVLSLVLSIVVGRGLTKSIRRLTYAASAVGRGRLNVLLPEHEPGEFGDLFRAFNLMVKKLRRARSREVQSARILAWGEMAQQVSHEIKNPLTPMKLSMQHVRRAFNDRHPQFPNVLDDSVTQVLLEIDHLDRIARAFSRYGAPEQNADAVPLQLFAIRSLVEETLPLYRSGHDGTEYRQYLADDLPPVRTRPTEFKEVLLNLLENARAARDSGVPGVITVRAYRSGSGVRIEISDLGAGIAPDMIGRVFDPHFSTRSSGTGLGLAIVRRLVEGWGATVSIDSEVGRGTTVTIQLMTS